MTRTPEPKLSLTQTSLRVPPRAPSAVEAICAARLKNAVTVAWGRAVLVTATLVPHAASGAASSGDGLARLLLHVLFAVGAPPRVQERGGAPAW